ncbi:unnamed protein product [Caenorhabditis nigoni]
MNQQIGDEDAQEQELRARIMELRETIRVLERPENAELGRGLGPLEELYLDGLQQVLERQRVELNDLERFHRATYRNVLEQIDRNQQIGDEDAQEQELRARIMELRRTIRRLERQQDVVLPERLQPMVVELFYQMAFEESQRQRTELDNAEGLYRATYPNLVERINIQEENDEDQEDLLDVDHFNAVMVRAHQLLQEQGNPVIAPQQLGDQEFREQFLQAERHAQRQVAVRRVPPNLIRLERLAGRRIPNMNAFPVIRFIREDQNPEELRQEEGPEHQGGPENRPEILIVIRRPAEAPVVERHPPEEQREVVGSEGRREAQPEEQPEGLVDDDGVPHPRNQDEPGQEDEEGPENRNPEEPRQ